MWRDLFIFSSFQIQIDKHGSIGNGLKGNELLVLFLNPCYLNILFLCAAEVHELLSAIEDRISCVF